MAITSKKVFGIILYMCQCLQLLQCSEFVQYSAVVETELQGTVTLPLSWKPSSPMTLTVSHNIRNVLIEVLHVNDTDVILSNCWKERAVAILYNDTEIVYLNVTLTDVTIEVEGNYLVRLVATDDETYTRTHHNVGTFRIDTYARPIYINIDANATGVDEHAMVAITCAGNIGRPAGDLHLLQSSFASTDYFYSIETIHLSKSADLHDSLLPNGTFYIQHVFLRNMSRTDSNRTHKCAIIQYANYVTRIESNALSIHVNCLYGESRSYCPMNSSSCLKLENCQLCAPVNVPR